MPNFTLEQLLRYGFSGAIGILIFLAAFEEPAIYILTNDNQSLSFGIVLGAFAIGALSYSIYRALLYQFIYLLSARAAGRKESLESLDLARWTHRDLPGNLQSRMAEWASQVHFLFSSTLTSIALLLFGVAADFNHSGLFGLSWIAVWVLIWAATVSSIRFQEREVEVFRRDGQSLIKLSQAAAKSGE